MYLRKGGLYLLWPLLGLSPCNLFTHVLSWVWKAAFPFFLAKFRLFSTKKLGKFWNFFFSSVNPTKFSLLKSFSKFFNIKNMKKNSGEKEDIRRVITNH